jgi:hypothetical protein
MIKNLFIYIVIFIYHIHYLQLIDQNKILIKPPNIQYYIFSTYYRIPTDHPTNNEHDKPIITNLNQR